MMEDYKDNNEYFLPEPWPIPTNGGVQTEFTNLVHVTHSKTAEEIISSGFEFKAFPKTGRPDGTSYKITGEVRRQSLSDIKQKVSKDEVSDMESLICDGCFSWLGIKVEPSTRKPLKRDGYELSRQFTDESIYGTVGISVPFDVVIDSYKDSFGPGNVLFKYPGILSYTREDCYVILVCVQEEGKPDPLPQFSTVPEYTAGSSVCITHPYKWIGRRKFRWDHYVFALYFPESHKTKSFYLRPCTVTLFPTEHIQKLCIRRKSEGTCPDQDNVTIDDLCSLRKRCLKHNSKHKIEIPEVMMNHLNTFLKTFSKRKWEDDNSEKHDTDDSEDENNSEEFGQKKAKKRKTTSNDLN